MSTRADELMLEAFSEGSEFTDHSLQALKLRLALRQAKAMEKLAAEMERWNNNHLTE